jgi:hypothetical protein
MLFASAPVGSVLPKDVPEGRMLRGWLDTGPESATSSPA